MLRLVASRLGSTGASLTRSLGPELGRVSETQLAASSILTSRSLPAVAEPGLLSVWQRPLTTSVGSPCAELAFARPKAGSCTLSACTQASVLQETATKPDAHHDQHTKDAREGAGVEHDIDTSTQDPRETQKRKYVFTVPYFQQALFHRPHITACCMQGGAQCTTREQVRQLLAAPACL